MKFTLVLGTSTFRKNDLLALNGTTVKIVVNYGSRWRKFFRIKYKPGKYKVKLID